MYINYEYYRVFYYVAKLRSFTRAAAYLLNNQPNITRIIRNLENELGCVLFIRSNRGVSLTPEGEKLYRHVAVAVEHITLGEEELSLERELQSGMVSIGASELALHCFLLPVLKQFHRQYPGIRIRVTNHSTPQAILALDHGLVDLAVSTTPHSIPEQMSRTVLKEFSEIAVCGPSLAQLAGRTLDLAELARFPLICLGPQTKTYELYSGWFMEHGLKLEPEIEVATADQILPMIRNDLGIGFLPRELAAADLEQGAVFPLSIRQEIPRRGICLFRKTDRPMSVAARRLEQAMLDRSGGAAGGNAEREAHYADTQI